MCFTIGFQVAHHEEGRMHDAGALSSSTMITLGKALKLSEDIFLWISNTPTLYILDNNNKKNERKERQTKNQIGRRDVISGTLRRWHQLFIPTDCKKIKRAKYQSQQCHPSFNGDSFQKKDPLPGALSWSLPLLPFSPQSMFQLQFMMESTPCMMATLWPWQCSSYRCQLLANCFIGQS